MGIRSEVVVVGVEVIGVQRADVGTVDHEHDSVTAAVITLPQLPQRVLAAHVPDLEVHVRQIDGGDVLADGGDGLGGGGGVGGEVEGFDGGEEGRFAGVVEAEEEDGVFWGWGGGFSGGRTVWGIAGRDGKAGLRDMGRGRGEEGEGEGMAHSPSLLVNWRYSDLAKWYILSDWGASSRYRSCGAVAGRLGMLQYSDCKLW